MPLTGAGHPARGWARAAGVRRLALLGVVLLAASPALWRLTQDAAAPLAFAGPAPHVSAAGEARRGDPPPLPKPEPEDASIRPPTVRSASGQPGAAVHAASVVLLSDGRLRAAWFSGSREGAADVSIRTATFDPVQGQWSAESDALTRPALALATARYIKKLGNPVLARAPDGRLHLYVVAVSLGGWAGSSITRLVSDDEGRSWHSPRRLVTSPFLNLSTLVKGVPVAYADGRVGLPVYHELVERFPEWLVLDPQGRVLSRTRLPQSIRNLQPVVRVLDAQQAEMLMRHASDGTPPRIMRSRTRDAGRHWSAPEATGLPNPNAAVSVLARRGGDSLMVFNDAEAGRGNLSLAWAPAPSGEAPLAWRRLARLDGEPSDVPPGVAREAWQRALTAAAVGVPVRLQASATPSAQPTPAEAAQAIVDTAARQLCFATPSGEVCNREYSYPSLVESPDGAVHVLYTWHRARIQHLRLDPAWLDARQAEASR